MSVVFLLIDSQQLASASSDKTVKIWDIATGRCLQTLIGHNEAVQFVAFSAERQWIASVSDDKAVKIWDSTTGQCLHTFFCSGTWVKSVTFSTDGQWLAAALLNKTVKIWDTTTGECLQTLYGHKKAVKSVTFSADDQFIASASYDKTIKIWDAITGNCLQTISAETTHLTFDLMTNARLYTDAGVLSLEVPFDNPPTNAPIQGIRYYGYGVSPDGVWIMKDGRRVLWIPWDYRPRSTDWRRPIAIAGPIVSIGTELGHVLVAHLSPDGPNM